MAVINLVVMIKHCKILTSVLAGELQACSEPARYFPQREGKNHREGQKPHVFSLAPSAPADLEVLCHRSRLQPL